MVNHFLTAEIIISHSFRSSICKVPGYIFRR